MNDILGAIKVGPSYYSVGVTSTTTVGDSTTTPAPPPIPAPTAAGAGGRALTLTAVVRGGRVRVPLEGQAWEVAVGQEPSRVNTRLALG